MKKKFFFFFYRKNNFIFCFDEYIIDSYVFESRKLCILQLFITKIFDIVYDAKNNHANFRKCYKQLIFFYFMKRLFKQLRDYIRYYSKY